MEKFTPYEAGSHHRAADLYEEKRDDDRTQHGQESYGNAWPFDSNDLKPAKKIKKFYVDHPVSGDTIAEFTEAQQALDFVKKYGGVARPYCPTPEQIDEQAAQLKENKRFASTTPHRSLTQTKPRKLRKIHSAN